MSIISNTPVWFSDGVAFVVGVGAVVATITQAFRGFKRWLTVELVDPLSQKIDKLDSYARHHLGPNGDSPPLHEQVKEVRDHQLRCRLR